MPRVTRKTRQLGFQSLESRELMAGNVAVNLADGVLQITGDNAANGVEVEQVDGYYYVRGLPQGGYGTLINGGKSAYFAKGVQSIDISTNGGNDRVGVKGMASPYEMLPKDLTIRSGDGNDEVSVTDFWVKGHGSIATDATRAGADTLTVHQSIFYGRLDVATGGGSDSIAFTSNGGSLDFNTAHEGFRINSGTGTREGDNLSLDHLFTWKGIDIVTSDADDVVAAHTILAYEGHVTVETFGGNDKVQLVNDEGWSMDWQLTTFPTSVFIETGNGTDSVVLNNVDVRGSISIETGSENDTVLMQDVDARERFFIDLGLGDDTLDIEASSAADAILAGNDHENGDRLYYDNENIFDQLWQGGWETIVVD